MSNTTLRARIRLGIVFTAISLLYPVVADAHCDGLDGPVVGAARKALDSGDVNLTLVWVQPRDEAQIRSAFARTLAVRKLSPEARELADTYFFETLVRIHRAGEGAPYTGLKPAGRDLGPAIPAADKALAGGSVEPLGKLLTHAVHEGLQARFEEAMKAAKYAKGDVEGGRRFVRAYVEYVHFAERVYAAIVATHQESSSHEEKPAGAAHGHP